MILDQIYDGNFKPEDIITEECKTWVEARDRVVDIQNILETKLSEEDFKLVIEMEELLDSYSDEENKLSYKLGFATAMSLIEESKEILDK